VPSVCGVDTQFGDHVEQNLTAAALYVKRASDAGSADGLLLMGFMHSLGLGVRKDPAKVPAGDRLPCAASSER